MSDISLQSSQFSKGIKFTIIKQFITCLLSYSLRLEKWSEESMNPFLTRGVQEKWSTFKGSTSSSKSMLSACFVLQGIAPEVTAQFSHVKRKLTNETKLGI
jgi:hypothetical protein